MLVLVAAASASTPKLTGTVGPGYKITLTQGGTKVTKLKAGKYTFVINDKASTLHSYGLDGPNGFAKDFSERLVQGHQDDHGDPEEGQVQVLLSAARELHVRQLHGFVGGSEGTAGRARVAGARPCLRWLLTTSHGIFFFDSRTSANRRYSRRS